MRFISLSSYPEVLLDKIEPANNQEAPMMSAVGSLLIIWYAGTESRDLAVFDTETKEWTVKPIQGRFPPSVKYSTSVMDRKVRHEGENRFLSSLGSFIFFAVTILQCS